VDNSTPLCERILAAMTNDELIMTYLREKLITVDAENGLIYSTRTDRGQPLKGYPNKDGYISHHLRYGEKDFKVLAHRIVWMSQNGFIPPRRVIDHINRVKDDNRIANLRVVTHRENCLNRGPYEQNHVYGEAHHKAKLTIEQVKEIRRLYANRVMSQDKLARLYGMGQSTISSLIRGEIWKECLPQASDEKRESA
jgi:hypothetical protein